MSSYLFFIFYAPPATSPGIRSKFLTNFSGLRAHDDPNVGLMTGDARNGVNGFTVGHVQLSPSGKLYGPVDDGGTVLEVKRVYLFVKRCV